MVVGGDFFRFSTDICPYILLLFDFKSLCIEIRKIYILHSNWPNMKLYYLYQFLFNNYVEIRNILFWNALVKSKYKNIILSQYPNIAVYLFCNIVIWYLNNISMLYYCNLVLISYHDIPILLSSQILSTQSFSDCIWHIL